MRRCAFRETTGVPRTLLLVREAPVWRMALVCIVFCVCVFSLSVV